MKAIVTILALSASLQLSGCLATPQVNSDLQEMKRRLAAVEQVTVAKRGPVAADQSISEQTRKLADLQAELDALRVEFQRLSGQFEDSNHENQRVNEQLAQMRSELDLRLAGFEERLAALEQGGPGTTAPAAASEASYEKGLKLIQKESRFAEGRKELQAFLKANAKHELAVNAMYWIGEAYYGEKQYEKAILQFQDVLQKYPKHIKAPAAMLKQALAFEALGDKQDAQARLKQVISTYPNSPEAAKAKQRLK